MKYAKIQLSCIVGLGILLGGCSKSADSGPSTASVPEKVESSTAAATANPETSIMTEAAGQAIKKKSYAEAVMAINDMGRLPMTVEQGLAYRNLKRNLQTELATAAAAGDQDAIAAIQLLRMASTPGP